MKDHLSVPEVAEILGVSDQTVRLLEQQSKLVPLTRKRGEKRKYHADDVRDYLAAVSRKNDTRRKAQNEARLTLLGEDRQTFRMSQGCNAANFPTFGAEGDAAIALVRTKIRVLDHDGNEVTTCTYVPSVCTGDRSTTPHVRFQTSN